MSPSSEEMLVHVSFTAHLERHVGCPAVAVPASTVKEALEAVFAQHPRLRSYVLDDQGAVRRHVVVFAGGRQIRDPQGQGDPVAPGSEIHVMQALSGG